MQQFILDLEQLLNVAAGDICPETLLKNIKAWDSMAVVEFIALSDEKYNMVLDLESLANCKSVADLYQILKH